MVLSDDAYVVSRIAKCLGVGPGPKGNHRLVGDVPFGVGQHQVLSGSLSRQKRGACRCADRSGSKAIGEGETVASHLVNDGGLGVRVA